MHTIAPAAQRRRPAGAAWLIVVVVLGVLAMHGLSGHGMSSASDVEMTLTPDTPSSMAAPGHTVDAADQVAPAHPDHGMSATGMMCVAVLAGAVLLHARGYQDRTHATILAASAVGVVLVVALRAALQLSSGAALLTACATLVLLPAAGLVLAAVVPNTIYNPGFKLTVEWIGYLLFFASFPLAFWLMGVFAAIRYRS